jgi:hypothetical protein
MKYTYEFYNENTGRTYTTYEDELKISTTTSSFIKLFPIMYDKDKNEKFINIFRSYIIDDNNELHRKILFNSNLYICEESEWYENIAYKYYLSPFYWWLVCMLNNVQNPFEDIESGKNINIMSRTLLYTLTKELEQISELN